MEGRTTGGTRNPTYHALQWRNTIGVMVKNLPLRWVLINGQWILRHQLGGMLASARSGMLASHLCGLVQTLPTLPYWLRERNRIRTSRRLKAREFESALVVGGRSA
jgi:hypothetical protein